MQAVAKLLDLTNLQTLQGFVRAVHSRSSRLRLLLLAHYQIVSRAPFDHW